MESKEIVSKIKEKLELVDSLLDELIENDDSSIDCNIISEEIIKELNNHGDDIIDSYEMNIVNGDASFSHISFDESTIEFIVEKIINKHIKNK